MMPDVYTVIEALDSPGKHVNMQLPGFIPDITYQGMRHWQAPVDIPNYYIFPKEGDNVSVADVNTALAGLGGAYSLRHFVEVYMDQYKACLSLIHIFALKVRRKSTVLYKVY